MNHDRPLRVAVVGTGTMGAGIAQVAAMAGHTVRACDRSSKQLAAGEQAMRASLERLAAKGAIQAGDVEGALRATQWTPDPERALERAEVVIEAVVERLEVKQRVFGTAAAMAAPDALLGTNTSQLSIGAIAESVPDAAQRVIGLHFFNPAVLMRLVEIVRGPATSDDTLRRAEAFAAGLGKETVVCRTDSPGFLTSRVSAIIRLECLRMIEEGVGTASDIDRALTLGLNFPIGPLELGDRNGHDTFLDIVESLHASLGERFEPPATLRSLVAAGRLGRKTGWGIYGYDADGRRVDEEDDGT